MNLLLKTRLLRIAVIPVFFAATLSADTLILRDGRRIEGRLISYQDGVIEFQEGDSGGFYGRVNKEDVSVLSSVGRNGRNLRGGKNGKNGKNARNVKTSRKRLNSGREAYVRNE